MLMAQVSCLEDDPSWVSRLHDPVCEFNELAPGARLSRSMRTTSCTIASGNPLFINGHAFLILVVGCFAVGGRFGVVGHQCVAVRSDPYVSEWDVQPAIGQRHLEPADVLKVARHWRSSACPNRLTVLH